MNGNANSFEFKIEFIGNSVLGVFAFGHIQKGTIREGDNLVWRGQNGSEQKIVCQGIAGAEKRIYEAGVAVGHENVGLLLGQILNPIKPGEYLVCQDQLSEYTIVTDLRWEFSILGGVKKIS